MMPSAKHKDCVVFDIKPLIMDHKDVTKVGWKLDKERWDKEQRKFLNVGTSEAKFAVEDGFLIITNYEGEKASLRLPKTINPQGPIVAIDPVDLNVTLPRATASVAASG
jgi:hypothetical protein